MTRYIPVELLPNFRISSLKHKRKSPLLKIFWRQFCISLGIGNKTFYLRRWSLRYQPVFYF